MTGEVFNAHQLKCLEECFKIVSDMMDSHYREYVAKGIPAAPYEGNTAHWEMLKNAVNNFDYISSNILNNEIEKTDSLQWQEVMFLVETVNYECFRHEQESKSVLQKGLLLLVGMFRNQFPGQKWNPDDVRWTTVGDVGERGISPMLMAITEL